MFTYYVENISRFTFNIYKSVIFTIVNQYYEVYSNICFKIDEYKYIFNFKNQNEENYEEKIIISFKNTLQTKIVDDMINSLLKQTLLPYKIVMTLYIDDLQFMNILYH